MNNYSFSNVFVCYRKISHKIGFTFPIKKDTIKKSVATSDLRPKYQYKIK